jgi:hypothetical protein
VGMESARAALVALDLAAEGGGARRPRVGLAGDGRPLFDWGAGRSMWVYAVVCLLGMPLSWRGVVDRVVEVLRRVFDRVLRIGRTEQQRVYRRGQAEVYRRQNDVLYYRRTAVKDWRTCLPCLVADGQILDGPEVEDHPGGRCFALPVRRGQRPPASLRPGVEWFLGQPAWRQRVILGPGYWRAWRAGVGLAQMVTVKRSRVWGDVPALRPLSELV